MLPPEVAHNVMLRDSFLVGACVLGLFVFLFKGPWSLRSWFAQLAPAVTIIGGVVFVGSATWILVYFCKGGLAHRADFSLVLSGRQLSAVPLAVRYYPVGSLFPVNKFYVWSDTQSNPRQPLSLGLRYIGGAQEGDELRFRSIEIDSVSQSYELLQHNNLDLIGRDSIVLRPGESLTIAGVTKQARVSVAPKHFEGMLELLLNSTRVGVLELTKDRLVGSIISFDIELGNNEVTQTKAGGVAPGLNLFLKFPASGMRIERVEVQSSVGEILGKVDSAEFVSIRTSLAEISETPAGVAFAPADPEFNAMHSNFQYMCMILAPFFFSLVALAVGAGFRHVMLSPRASFLGAATLFFMIMLLESLVLIDIWPGAYTADSFIFPGIEAGVISHYKPIIYTLYLGILRSISGAPAFPLLFQVVIAAALFSGLGAACWARGRVGWLGILISTAVIFVSPVLPLYLVTLWKDIAYGVGLAFVFVVIFYLQRSQARLPNSLLMCFFVPMVVFVAGFRHTGILGAIVVFAALFAGRIITRTQVLCAVGAFFVFSSLIGSFVNVVADSKARTEYDRLRVFPYIIYASYLPLKDHLDSLTLSDATRSRAAIERVASVDDFNGIDLMFSPDKVRFSLTDAEFKEFSNAILRGIALNSLSFMRALLIANGELITGSGYVWDRGFLPLSRRLAFDGRFYFSDEYVVKPHVLRSISGLGVVSRFEEVLAYRHDFILARLLFSYLPHLLILLGTILLWRRAPAAALFAAGTLAAYSGVFLMPASMEFRYGFNLMVAGVVSPLLVAIDWRSTDQG